MKGSGTMRLVGAGALVYLLAITFAVSGAADTNHQPPSLVADLSRDTHGRGTIGSENARDGRQIFRFDTFGDEQLWTDVLRMHEVLPAVDPATALAVGLKVDVKALPPAVIDALRAGQVDLTDPAVTVELLRLNAVVGVKGTVNEEGG